MFVNIKVEGTAAHMCRILDLETLQLTIPETIQLMAEVSTAAVPNLTAQTKAVRTVSPISLMNAKVIRPNHQQVNSYRRSQ